MLACDKKIHIVEDKLGGLVFELRACSDTSSPSLMSQRAEPHFALHPSPATTISLHPGPASTTSLHFFTSWSCYNSFYIPVLLQQLLYISLHPSPATTISLHFFTSWSCYNNFYIPVLLQQFLQHITHSILFLERAKKPFPQFIVELFDPHMACLSWRRPGFWQDQVVAEVALGMSFLMFCQTLKCVHMFILSRLKSISTLSCTFVNIYFHKDLVASCGRQNKGFVWDTTRLLRFSPAVFPILLLWGKQTRKEQCDAGYYHIKLCSLLQFPLFVLCGKTNTKRTIRCRVLSY